MNPALLVDASEVERLHPELCDRPTFKELKNIKPGDTVSIATAQKHFWATVTAIDGNTVTAVAAVELQFGVDNVFAIKKPEATHHEN